MAYQPTIGPGAKAMQVLAWGCVIFTGAAGVYGLFVGDVFAYEKLAFAAAGLAMLLAPRDSVVAGCLTAAFFTMLLGYIVLHRILK